MSTENLVGFCQSDPLDHQANSVSAILTSYENLRSYQLIQPKISPLDYEITDYYTNDLLDTMMAYKNIWKDIHTSKI